MASESGYLYFSVDARILSQLGEELVVDRTTALSELVKNAYDADATQVTVHFLDSSRGGVLQISDNGTGMDLEAIRGRWMRLSTGHKEEHPVSERFKRIRAGKKGIGRFAAHALGERLLLSTTVGGSGRRTIARFNWNRFVPGKSEERSGGLADLPLERIGSAYRVVAAPTDEHGTILRIKGLRTAWTRDDLLRVQRAIQLLQPPFPIADEYLAPMAPGDSEGDPGFEVATQVGAATGGDAKDVLSRSERERFLEAATAVVQAEVSSDGTATWRVRSQRLELDETATYPKKLLLVGALSLHASYFIHVRDAIGSLNVKISQAMGRKYGGIRVYRDDLRVPPYGDQNSDWLGLDLLVRRREILYPLANDNWFGHISLSRDRNVLLVDTASREGVIENEAFEELRAFVRDALIDCGRRVAHARGRKERARKRDLPVTESRAALVEKTVKLAREAMDLAAAGQHTRARDTLARASTVQVEARQSDVSAQRAESALLDEIALLRILASLGTSIVVFSHEVRSAINASKARLVDIEEDAEGAPEPWRSQSQRTIGSATSAIDRLDDLAGFIEGYTSRSRRREREAQPVHAVLEAFAKAFRRLLERQSAEISWEVEPPNLRTRPMARSELDAILINLLTNSLKAFEGGTSKRRIRVTAEEDGGDVLLRFQDSGKGIPEEIRDTLFEPFVTTSLASDNDLGVGTGLGLKIVYDIAEANRGSAGVGHADEGFTTCFEVRVAQWKVTGEADG